MDSLLKYHDLILCVTTALEARDPYTSYHSSRVAEMTEALCGFLELSDEETELFHISAHLHDIGKIGVRDGILMKEGKLTDEEWAMMKSHSEKGYQILMTVPALYTVAGIVRSHHERYDGKGYPDGLKGESIPFGSRIIAVADSVDAMLSDRPYRKGMSPERCLEEIQKNAGMMYDPVIAACAIQHWDSLLKARESELGTCSIYQDVSSEKKG